jgi:predicted DNA-binding transcriptional regulator AlpA
MAEGWLTGWKEISKYIGVSKDTCKRYIKQYSLPIKRRPGGRPSAIPYEVDNWLIEFDKLKKKNKSQ